MYMRVKMTVTATSQFTGLAFPVPSAILKSDTVKEDKTMYRREIDPAEYADAIHEMLRRGIFLTSKAGDKVNTMVIGWGHIGRIWEKDVFVAYVRRNRYTHELLDANPEFTVNVPVHGFDPKAFAICGTKSGRDMDKIKEAGLTLAEPQAVSVPAIKEYPLTLECRIIYREEQDASKLPEEIIRKFYSVEKEDHISYYGEIKAAYILEEEKAEILQV